jgi:pyruvate/2-oxoglutarate dehydrogenase complex dihydrolipoamide dehydrogenase (E3) component
MTPLKPDLCIIGAGSAGLTLAAGAAQLGASVVLIEKGEMGGDCLNTGCVPSKALLAAAKQAQAMRKGAALGIRSAEPEVDFAAVMRHVRGVIDEIAPHDSQERFESLGVTVLRHHARFIDGRTVQAGDHHIRPRRVVIATGSRPRLPPIKGLSDVPALTNETLFNLESLPESLLILGGGPIGCEMAQAFRRLGSAVTLIETGTLLGRDDPDMVAVVRDRLSAEGIAVLEGHHATRVSGQAGAITVAVRDAGDRDSTVAGSHLLIATGRAPVVDGLDLERAGIETTPAGIRVTDGLQTTNRRVFAIGDVAGGPQFTHVAGHHGGLMIRRLLFRLPVRASAAVIPHVTYTDPELAAVGLTEAEARNRHGDAIRVLRWPFADNDRARAERRTDGLVKVVTSRRGHILGAAIVGADAGDLLAPWCLAMDRRLKVAALATMIAPYPTRSEAGKRAAGSFFTPRLFSPATRRLIRLLGRLQGRDGCLEEEPGGDPRQVPPFS